MATKKKFEFKDMPIDNTDIFIRDVPKYITQSLAKLIFPSVQEYFESKEDE
jgi:hypothetical protein